MVKDHSDSKKGNPLLQGPLFFISSKGSFICTIPDRIAHTTAFVTPVVELWLGSYFDSERGNPLLQGPLFFISSKGSFICTITQRRWHIQLTAVDRPAVGHWLKLAERDEEIYREMKRNVETERMKEMKREMHAYIYMTYTLYFLKT